MGILLLASLIPSLSYGVKPATAATATAAATDSGDKRPAPAVPNSCLARCCKKGGTALGIVIGGFLGYRSGAIVTNNLANKVLAPTVARSMQQSPVSKTLCTVITSGAGVAVGGSLGHLAGAGAAKAIDGGKGLLEKTTSYVQENKESVISYATGASIGILGIILLSKVRH